MKSITTFVCGVTLAAVAPVAAQTAQTQNPRDLAQARYRVTTMERILEGAAEHGAKGARDRFKTMMPGDFLLTDDVHVRGFELEGWGVFFDVQMPPLESTMPFILRTFEQTDLTIENSFRTLRTTIEALNDPGARQQNSQALERVAIQMGVAPPAASVATQASTTRTVGAQSLAPSAAPVVDPAANDPQAAYHAEVRDAVIDAMLDHGLPLRLKPEQRLTVAIRGADNLPRLGPGEPESPTIMISVSGADLTALSMAQITRDEARRRVRVED
jgi:hypothetical protein